MVSNIENKGCHTLWTGTVLRRFFPLRVVLHSTPYRNENTALPQADACTALHLLQAVDPVLWREISKPSRDKETRTMAVKRPSIDDLADIATGYGLELTR